MSSDDLLAGLAPADAFEHLVALDWQLSRKNDTPDASEYPAILDQLLLALNVYCRAEPGEKSPPAESVAADDPLAPSYSLQVGRMLAKTLSRVLGELPNKVYDVCNRLVGFVAVHDDGTLPELGKVACLVLADVLAHHPLQVSSLIDYTITHLYKLLKKNPAVDALVVYLASVVLGIAQKDDVGDKTLAKLDKLFVKAIMLSQIATADATASTDTELPQPNVAQVVYYLYCLKNVLVLQTRSHYEHLLKVSVAAASGAKLKSEALMAQQHQFQQTLLAAHEKVFLFGFRSQFSEVRSATVDLVAHVLLGFFETENFDPAHYLIALYPLPPLNVWDASLAFRLDENGAPVPVFKKESNTLVVQDSEGRISHYTGMLLVQISCVEALLFFMQLEHFQSPTDRLQTVCAFLDAVLRKFADADHPRHVQNQPWARCLEHWSVVIRHVISEAGSTTHEVLARYVAEKFVQPAVDDVGTLQSRRKRELIIFGFGALKKNKHKDTGAARINLRSNGYQIKLLMDIALQLVPYGVDLEAAEQKNCPAELAPELVKLADEEEDRTTGAPHSYTSELLFAYLGSDCDCVRYYSLQALVRFAQINQKASNQLILDAFQKVSHEYSHGDGDDSGRRHARLFVHALALLALIQQSEITLLQNSTIAKLLSFCTQNLKNNEGLKMLKAGACWIILTSLVTLYRDLEFVKVNSSQFLWFWKNLLTSQFVNSSLVSSADAASMQDVLCNLKLRTLGLACLLNYILALEHLPEMARQLQFFLVKSHKYLLYLESTVENVGPITGLGLPFNECDFNVDVVGNLLFSNGVDGTQFAERDQLVALILYNKKIVLQGLVKLAHHLKSDVNSSLVVFLVNVFLDPRAFSRNVDADASREKAKNKKPPADRVAHTDHGLVLLEEEYNYNYGVTSKFDQNSGVVDELWLRAENSSSDDTRPPESASKGTQDLPHVVPSPEIVLTCAGVEPTHSGVWNDELENHVYAAAYHSIAHDPLALVLGHYSARHVHAPSLVTALVDLSIELMVLVFPSLSYKIQFSLLEQLQAAVTAKKVDPLRRKAILVNLTVVLHALFSNLHKNGHTLDESLVLLAVDVIDTIDTPNHHAAALLADATGLACTQLAKKKTEELVTTRIARIAASTDPWRRGRILLAVCRVHKHCHALFLEIYSVVVQLLQDQHPVMAFYALRAVATLLEDAAAKQGVLRDVLQLLYHNFVHGYYANDSSDSLWVNLRYTHALSAEFLRVVTVVLNALGPDVARLDEPLKRRVFSVLYACACGLGCADQRETIATLAAVAVVLQELLVFDAAFMPHLSAWLCAYNAFLVAQTMKCGVGATRPVYLDRDAVFPFTTSPALGDAAFASLVQMTKLGVRTLDASTLNLTWVAMELRPCAGAGELAAFWIDAYPEQPWFARLIALFCASARRVVGSFLELHYEQKMLPLLQRGKKDACAGASLDFRDEEAEGIVPAAGTHDDKNHPVRWEFRLVIYDLLIRLLTPARANAALVEAVKPSVQELIRISFLGTRTPILAIRLRGIRLLDQTLGLVGDLSDPLYPDTSILEQQQAQIISAIIPCFGADSDPEVIVAAITVLSRFINLPRIKFYSKQRILRTMIYLLEEILSDKFLKFVFLESMAEYSKKAIQLAILNCWAVLKLRVAETPDLPPELRDILDKYARLLVLLWILVLKDLSTLKYSQLEARELALYHDYWLNFVAVLTMVLDADAALMRDLLQDEYGNFFFVIFCQCLEALMRSADVEPVLACVVRLIRIPELARALLDPPLFDEVVDLLDRLVLMEKDAAVRGRVVDVARAFFDVLPADARVMRLELMRVAMLPLFETSPFLRADFGGDSARCPALPRDAPQTLLLAGNLMAAVVHMAQALPATDRPDVFACTLYIFAKLYEHGSAAIIGAVLPHLKEVVAYCQDLAAHLVAPFFQVLRRTAPLTSVAPPPRAAASTLPTLPAPHSTARLNYIATMMLFAPGLDVVFYESEAQLFATSLVDGLLAEDSAATCVQSLKSLIASAGSGQANVDAVVRHAVRALLLVLLRSEPLHIDVKLAFEFVLVFLQSPALGTDDRVTQLLKMLVPVMLKMHHENRLPTDYLRMKMMLLVRRYPAGFKTVVMEHLDAGQKEDVEALVTQHTGPSAAEAVIELKVFGIESLVEGNTHALNDTALNEALDDTGAMDKAADD